MSEEDDPSDEAFSPEFSRKDSELQFQPRGLEEANLIHNTIVLRLSQSTVLGPVKLGGNTVGRRFLGSGAAFDVFGTKFRVDPTFPAFDGPWFDAATKNASLGSHGLSGTRLVAIKRAKVIESLDVHGSGTSIRTRKNGQADLSILSLIDSELRTLLYIHHPNIVKLLAWGFEPENEQGLVSRSLLLIMEHAIGSAAKILDAVDLPLVLKCHLCSGVARGVEALHYSSIAHGDIKPENVLVFGKNDSDYGLLAKIADFNCTWHNKSSQVPKGTYGWTAPEIEYYDEESPNLLDKLLAADIWSLGLTIWSILLERGRAIPIMAPQQYGSRFSLKLEIAGVSHLECQGLKGLILQMLQVDGEERPRDLKPLRLALRLPEVNSTDMHLWDSLWELVSQNHAIEIATEEMVLLKPRELQDLFHRRIPPQQSRNSWLHSQDRLDEFWGKYSFLKWNDKLPPHLTKHLYNLFSFALGAIDDWIKNPEEAERIGLNAMIQCAKRGYFPAQALCAALLNNAHEDLPSGIETYFDEWNFNGVASGFLFSPWTRRRDKRSQYWQALETFRSSGGYNLHYCGQQMAYWDSSRLSQDECVSGLIGLLDRDLEGYPVHLAAALNHPNLVDLLRINAPGSAVHLEDRAGDTPLMKCCMAGHIEALRCLVHAKSDAGKVNSISGYNASHWLFVFPDAFAEEAAMLLAQAGADFNACNTDVPSAFHMPFQWPRGNALHWAIFAKKMSAARAIIQQNPSTIQQPDYYGQAPLHVALKMLDSPMVDMLLEVGADLSRGGLDHPNGLFYNASDTSSSGSGSSGVLMDSRLTLVHNFLSEALELGSIKDLLFMSQKYRLALFRAGEHASSVRSVLQVVLRHCPDCLRFADSDGDYPLHHFVGSPHSIIRPDILEMFLEHGPGLHDSAAAQHSALNLLFIRNCFVFDDETLSALLERQLSKVPEEVCSASLNMSHPLPQPLEPPYPSYPMISYYRPAHFVAELGLVGCLRVLVALGADPFLRTEDTGLSPLDVAIAAENYTVPAPYLPSCSSLSSTSNEEGILTDSGRQNTKIGDGDYQAQDNFEAPEDHGQGLDSLANAKCFRSAPTRFPFETNTGVLPPMLGYSNFEVSLKCGKEGRNKCIEFLQTTQSERVANMQTMVGKPGDTDKIAL